MGVLNYATAAALTFGSKVAALVASLGTAIVLARSLGPEARGEYALATVLAFAIVSAVQLGLGSANIHFVGRDPGLFGRAAANAVVYAVAAGGATAAAITVVALAAGPLLPIRDPLVIAIVALSIPQALLYLYLQSLLQAIRSFVAVSVLIVASYVLLLVSLVVLVGLAGGGLPGALGAWFLTHAIIALASLGSVARVGGWAPPDGDLFRRSVRFGITSHTTTLAVLVATRAGLAASGLLLPAVAVGWYAVAISVTELLWYVAEAAAFGLAPFVAGLTGPRADALTQATSRIVAGVTFAGALSLFVLADLVAALFGPGFAPVAMIARWLLPGTAAYAIAKTITADLVGRGDPARAARGLWLGALVGVVALVFLVPAMGIAGVAAGTSLGYGVAAAALIASHSRLTGGRWLDLVLPRPADARRAAAVGRRFLW